MIGTNAHDTDFVRTKPRRYHVVACAQAYPQRILLNPATTPPLRPRAALRLGAPRAASYTTSKDTALRCSPLHAADQAG